MQHKGVWLKPFQLTWKKLSQKFLKPKNFREKISGARKLTQKNCNKKFLEPKNCPKKKKKWSLGKMVSKNSEAKKFLERGKNCHKNFWSQKIFGKKFPEPKNCRKKFLEPKNFCSRKFALKNFCSRKFFQK